MKTHEPLLLRFHGGSGALSAVPALSANVIFWDCRHHRGLCSLCVSFLQSGRGRGQSGHQLGSSARREQEGPHGGVASLSPNQHRRQRRAPMQRELRSRTASGPAMRQQVGGLGRRLSRRLRSSVHHQCAPRDRAALVSAAVRWPSGHCDLHHAALTASRAAALSLTIGCSGASRCPTSCRTGAVCGPAASTCN